MSSMILDVILIHSADPTPSPFQSSLSAKFSVDPGSFIPIIYHML